MSEVQRRGVSSKSRSAELLTTNAAYEIKTLHDAIERAGVVCRVRIMDGMIRVDLIWTPPQGFTAKLKPFMKGLPSALIKDLEENGFTQIAEAPINDLIHHGILSASFRNAGENARAIARTAIVSHDLHQGNIVAWAGR